MPTTVAQLPPLSLSEYAARGRETDQFANVPGGASNLTFGYFGEVGGLLAALKKVRRDRLLESETEVAGEELGDALWYLVASASAQGLDPQALGYACIESLRRRFNESEQDYPRVVSFRQIDGLIQIHGDRLIPRRLELLAELARLSGEVVGDSAGPQLALSQSNLAGRYGQLLAALGLVASSFSLRLEGIARDNLLKTHERWSGPDKQYTHPFDLGYPEHERFPRVLPIEFIERKAGSSTYVVQRLHGVYIGDRLTDNSHEPDDYRFHDVFHLAYVAHLGWSPVVRSLLKIKRKSRPEIDENEDGARAMIIEEGIATWIFNHARKRKLYEDIEPGKLDYGLLKQVHGMVSGYEVGRCPLWQWEQAILEGFGVFRELCKPENRGGTVMVDMDKHTLAFLPPSRTPSK